MKILALDIGDRWTGVAISDALGLLARPYDTIETHTLIPWLTTLTTKERIRTVVVGYPKTLRGTESEQTLKTKTLADQLKRHFDHLEWVLWDERLTSKQAATLKPAKDKDAKKQSHAIAAALFLQSYLEYLHLQKNAV